MRRPFSPLRDEPYEYRTSGGGDLVSGVRTEVVVPAHEPLATSARERPSARTFRKAVAPTVGIPDETTWR